MLKKFSLLAIISGLIISLDQLTKLFILEKFQLHDSVAIIENYFNITYVRNFGAAFGILAQTPPGFRDLFFVLMPPFACLMILYILWGVSEKHISMIVALSSVFGGAIGNYIDRLKYKYVVDFIDFHYYEKQTWPAFNLADVAIVLGVIGLIYLIIIKKQRFDSAK